MCTMPLILYWTLYDNVAYQSCNLQITLVDWASDQDTIISKPSKYGPRSCAEVTWNKQSLGQLAAGFDRLRSEECTCVYDVESALLTTSGDSTGTSVSSRNSIQQLTATHKFSFGDGCVSLQWIPQNPNLIAVGTTTGWIRVYDLRKGHPAAMSVMAHTNIRSKKVKGIRSDPFNHNLISTFSDSEGEPVKIWDLRKVEKAKEAPVFTVYPQHPTAMSGSSANTGMNSVTGSATNIAVDVSKCSVTDIEYSPERANVLAVGISKADCVLVYSTKSSHLDIQSRTPILTINVPDGVKNMSWNTGKSNGIEKKNFIPDIAGNQEVALDSSSVTRHCISTKDHHRLLIATRKMEYVDLTVVEQQPLAINAKNDILFGRNSSVVMAKSNRTSSKVLDRPSLCSTPPPSDSVLMPPVPDACFGIDDHLMRERCSAGYSVDSGKNLQKLSDELDDLDPTSTEASRCIQLLRAWSWVDRVETLNIKDDSFNLENSGILRLLKDDNDNDKDDGRGSHDNGLMHPSLGATVYLSPRRSVGRLLCGWAALHGLRDLRTVSENSSWKARSHVSVEHSESAKLSDIVHDCEMVEHFERGAALALWHGDLPMAVRVLQRAISSNTPGVHCGGSSRGIQSEIMSENDDGDDDVDTQDSDEMSDEGFLSHSANDNSSIRSTDGSIDSFLPSEYVELLSLVAMCIAGYSGPAFPKNSSVDGERPVVTTTTRDRGKNVDGKPASQPSSSGAMWSSMCQLVLTKLQSTDISSGKRGISYLYAACLFLLETQRNCSDYSVLNDKHIAFEDRVAFACTYLSYKQMSTFLLTLENQCMDEGNIEGLVITGLKTGDGMALLQRYVDLQNDIQTAALLVSRFSSTLEKDNAHSGSSCSHTLEKQFLQEYRMLLNRWEMYMTRASLDVELGIRYRSHQTQEAKKPSTEDSDGKDVSVGIRSGKSSSSRPGRTSGIGGGGGADKSGGGSVYRIPPHNDSPHVLLRCNFCRFVLDAC